MTGQEKAELLALLESVLAFGRMQNHTISAMMDLLEIIKQMRERLDLHQSLILLLRENSNKGSMGGETGGGAAISDEWRHKTSELEKNQTRLEEQFEAMQEMFGQRLMTGKEVAEKLRVIKGGKPPTDE